MIKLAQARKVTQACTQAHNQMLRKQVCKEISTQMRNQACKLMQSHKIAKNLINNPHKRLHHS